MPESAPPARAVLVEELALDDGPCAVFHARAARPIARALRFDDVGILFARGATILTVTLERGVERGPGDTFTMTAGQVVLLPARVTANVATQSSTSELFVVLPRVALVEQTARAYGVPFDQMQATLDGGHRIERQRWLDEVHHRYFFERMVCKKAGNVATAFLEMEIVKEAYFAVKNGAKPTCAPPFGDGETLGTRAVRYVESHLFEPLLLDDIARELHTSRATLVRRFREATGKAPVAYVRDRRLDEAHALLSRDRDAARVTDIAFAVGYENVGAFAQAFRRRFGRPPSAGARAADAMS